LIHDSSTKNIIAFGKAEVRILLVEDIDDHAQLISKFVTDRIGAAKIHLAITIAAALRAAKNETFDILLADYRVGEAECFDLLDQLRDAGIHIPTIVLTGQGNETVAAAAITGGVEDYLIKGQVFDDPSLLARSIRAVIERIRLQAALQESEELYRTLVENIQDGVFILRGNRIVFVNPSFSEIIATEAEEIIGRQFEQLFPASQRKEAKEMIGEIEGTGLVEEKQFTLVGNREKPEIYVDLTLLPCTYDGTEALIGTVKDITSRVMADRTLKNLLAEKERLSITDELTSLRNRRYVLQFLEPELARAKRYNTHLSLVMLDLDQFKQINDSYGHLLGDESLRVVSGILKREVRESDVVARYGGDEFMLVLPQTNLQQALVLAERVRSQIAERSLKTPDDEILSLTVSLGVSTVKIASDTMTDLIRRADHGLLRAKKLGRDRVETVEKIAVD
jgi:diguanylate cyclase (GGDEF)-like protein/PAS domain S-box-containing protein